MMLKGAKMARLGSARLGGQYCAFCSVCQALIPSYCQIKSGNWVYYALFPDFSFVGRGNTVETLRLNVRCCGCFNLFYRYTCCGNNS